MSPKLASLIVNIAGMLSQPDYIAWFCWDKDLEYLCTEEKKLIPHDESFLAAWVSTTKLSSCSYELNRLRILNDKNIFDWNKDLRR